MENKKEGKKPSFFLNADDNFDTTANAVQKAVRTVTLNFLVKKDILINKIIKKCHFSASKENRHYNMFYEKKPRLAVSRG